MTIKEAAEYLSPTEKTEVMITSVLIGMVLSDKPESACEGCRSEAFKPRADAIQPVPGEILLSLQIALIS